MKYKTHLNQWNGTSIASKRTWSKSTKTDVISLESSVDSMGKPSRHTDVESTLNQRRLSTLKQRWKMFDFVIEMTSDFNVEITSGFNAETSDFNVEKRQISMLKNVWFCNWIDVRFQRWYNFRFLYDDDLKSSNENYI